MTNGPNAFIYKRYRVTVVENKTMITKKEKRKKDKLGDWD